MNSQKIRRIKGNRRGRSYKECEKKNNGITCNLLCTEVVVQRCSLKRCSQKYLKTYRKTACQILFFNKVEGLRPVISCSLKEKTLAQVLSCKYCENSKNTFSYRTPPVAASVCSFCIIPSLLKTKYLAFFEIGKQKLTPGGQSINSILRTTAARPKIFLYYSQIFHLTFCLVFHPPALILPVFKTMSRGKGVLNRQNLLSVMKVIY